MRIRSNKEVIDFLSLIRSARAQYEHKKDRDNQLEKIAWYNIIRANKTMLEWILGFNDSYPEYIKEQIKNRNLK